MNNEARPAQNAGDEINSDVNEDVTELSEDIEVVSPGAMLRDARLVLSLSQEHIASKLNFKVSLVKNIEDDIFDPAMPTTFNRGYLANYAKLVAVDVEDILASYDALDAASIQRSEMLSFSRETAKQAEHSRVMWLSYFIVAVLIGLTVLWWQQESNQQAGVVDDSSASLSTSAQSNELATPVEQEPSGSVNSSQVSDSAQASNENLQAQDAAVIEQVVVANDTATPDTVASDNNATDISAAEKNQAETPEVSTAVFTFSGDCWVNIFDATGERIAWGVKKAGYVMTIQGKAPLKITVGKPELTSIVFNGQTVDMSAFNVGNIAKFNLPIIAQ